MMQPEIRTATEDATGLLMPGHAEGDGRQPHGAFHRDFSGNKRRGGSGWCVRW
jgi:hypothetical protein